MLSWLFDDNEDNHGQLYWEELKECCLLLSMLSWLFDDNERQPRTTLLGRIEGILSFVCKNKSPEGLPSGEKKISFILSLFLSLLYIR